MIKHDWQIEACVFPIQSEALKHEGAHADKETKSLVENPYRSCIFLGSYTGSWQNYIIEGG